MQTGIQAIERTFEMKLKNILLLDDDDVSNLICETMCRKLDFTEQIHIHENPEEALAYLKHANPLPELLILDLYMPIMEGADFIDSFRKSRKDFTGKIFILTAVIQEKELKKAWKTGIDELIMKPLSVRALSNVLRKNFPGIQLNPVSGKIQ